MTTLRTCTAAAVCALALATASAAAAQPGAFDSGFGSSGVVTTATAQLLGVAVQPDGEVIAAGSSAGNVFVERLTTSGAVNGTYTGPSGVARAVAVEPDGHIVIAGSTGGSMLVERLTSSLTPDGSFGSGGVATAFGGSLGVANTVALGPGGEIVAAGSVGNPPNTIAVVAEFSSGGSASTQSFGFGGDSIAQGVAVQPDGKIVLVGRRNPSQAVDAVIARLNPNGSLDGTFASGGAGTYDFPGAGSTVFGAVALLNNGQIVIGGQTNALNGPQALFARYNSNGTLDGSFGSGGATTVAASQSLNINPGYSVGAYGVGISGPAGDIVGGGQFETGAVEVDAAAWAVGPNGAPDGGFGSGGTQLGPGQATGASKNYEACAVAIAPDGAPDAGEIVTVGETPSNPDSFPCTNGQSSGFVASYSGYGPPPPPAAPPTGAAPTVSTGAATPVAQTSATVTGSVNPNGLSTSYHFEYGTSQSYGSSTTPGDAGSGSGTTSVSANLTGLAPSTTYHYRLVASNADGVVDGTDATFSTPSASAPSVTTGAASGTSEVSATLHGVVNGKGLPTTYHFQFGTGSSYGSSTKAGSVSSGTNVNVTAKLTGLKPGTTYHYRLVAANADGAVSGADRTFKTTVRLKSRLRGVKGGYGLAAVLKSGLAIKLDCNQSCSITGSLQISAALAKQLKLGSRKLTIAAGRTSLRRTGTAKLVLRIGKADRKAVSGHIKLSVTLRTVSKPAGGGPAVVDTKTITLTG